MHQQSNYIYVRRSNSRDSADTRQQQQQQQGQDQQQQAETENEPPATAAGATGDNSTILDFSRQLSVMGGARVGDLRISFRKVGQVLLLVLFITPQIKSATTTKSSKSTFGHF